MAVLLIAEITDGALAMDATSKAVTAAKSLGDVTVLAAGATAKAAADEAATIDGVSKVLLAEDALYGHRLAEPVAALIASLAGDYSHVVAPATTDAKNILPRVAALLDVMVSDRCDCRGGCRHIRTSNLRRQRDSNDQVQGRDQGHFVPDVDL
jgi:electron transfer flavoprotein alpha subunit